MRLLLCLLAALSALVCGTEASAAQFLYTITGQVVLDELSYDERQLFGPTLGSTFTAGFVVDDAVAQAIYDYGPTSSSATGGWASAPGTLPPITASLTIGGGTYAVRQGNSSSGPMISPDGEPFGGTSSQRDLGAIRKDAVARRFDLTTSYYEESSAATRRATSSKRAETTSISACTAPPSPIPTIGNSAHTLSLRPEATSRASCRAGPIQER
jgi:hypothetical protein